MSGYAVKIRTWPSFLGDSISSCMSRKADAFGGYPAGFDKSNFVFITPYESERKKWSSLDGVNLVDGKTCQIAMQPTINQDRVVPESFRILFRKYLAKPEVKSLAPDGTACTGMTHGLLPRETINAKTIVPVGERLIAI